VSGYTIIDADTHVTETPDLWTSRALLPCATVDNVRFETDFPHPSSLYGDEVSGKGERGPA
jgi:hypothetical protein